MDSPERTTLLGYTDHLSVVAGDRQRFMISADPRGRYRAELVRMICGDARPSGAGFREEPVDWSAAGEFEAGSQTIVAGSYGVTATVPHLDEGTICLYFMPTLLYAHVSTLLDIPNIGITITVQADGLQVSRRHSTPAALRHRDTRDVIAMAQTVGRRLFDDPAAAGDAPMALAVLRVPGQAPGTDAWSGFPDSVGKSRPEAHAERKLARDFVLCESPWLFAVRAGCDNLHNPVNERFFNGRIELPWVAGKRIEAAEALKLSEDTERLRADPRLVAAWDFSRDIDGDEFLDVSGNGLHGRFHNTPTRAVKGVRWDGSEQDWKRAPHHYGAVHFHEDDLTDAGWEAGIEWTVPETLSSGVYAVKLTRGEDEGYIPFFVRPSPRHAKAGVVLLASTATYLAYANTRFSMYAAMLDENLAMDPKDAYLRDHPEVGLSLYERHADGSGVHYSSHLRPTLNLGPKGRMWSFNADTNLTAWLHHLGVSFDVVTDADLDREGAALLDGYRVVITGTHPEYCSTGMLDGLENHLARGGRLMYLGGNGFYWRIAYHPRNRAVIELRRSEGRGLAWDSAPGEYYHAFSGEYGGLWRNLGRAPNRLVGVGFVALAGDAGTRYRRQPGADDPRAGFIFAGTSEGERFGDYGSVCGGAAGQEIDRWNPQLGSPGHALVLASSVDHPDDFRLVREEADARYPGLEGSKLRADMTFFETPAGGAVFATGSIGYAGALAHRDYDNDICRITSNVLERFLDPTPFPYPGTEEAGTGGKEDSTSP